MRWYYACKVRKGTVFIKGIYISGNSQMAELVRPNIQKNICRYCIYASGNSRMRWYYACACRVRKGTVFIKGIYTSGNSRMAELVRPNIQKKIADVRAWDDIMHKVHNGTVFIKGIYSSGNSRKAELVRPNIQKKIDVMHEMILCIKYTTVLYLSKDFRELMAELVRPNIQKKIDICIHEMILVRKGTVFIKGIYTSGNSRMANWFARTSQRKL